MDTGFAGSTSENVEGPPSRAGAHSVRSRIPVNEQAYLDR